MVNRCGNNGNSDRLPNSQSQRKLVLNVHWKDWCWSWNSNTLATWWEELTYLKRPWCWEKLKAGGEGDDRRWDGWVASPTQRIWVWVNSGSWRWTGRPGMLQSMGLQRVGHDWVTELIKELGIQAPKRRLFWGASLPSSRSAGSMISLFLASTHHLSDSLAYIMQWAERAWTW